MAKVTFIYYKLVCSLYGECTECDLANEVSNEVECRHAECFDDVPKVLIKQSNSVEFSGIDGYGNWSLKIGRKKFDSRTTAIKLLKIDDILICADEEKIYNLSDSCNESESFRTNPADIDIHDMNDDVKKLLGQAFMEFYKLNNSINANEKPVKEVKIQFDLKNNKDFKFVKKIAKSASNIVIKRNYHNISLFDYMRIDEKNNLVKMTFDKDVAKGLLDCDFNYLRNTGIIDQVFINTFCKNAIKENEKRRRIKS